MYHSGHYDVFICYRREGGYALASDLFHKLTLAGYRIFMDKESLGSGKFNEAILQIIEDCTYVLVILPPNALDRCVSEGDYVRREIEHALRHKKNVIPIMMRGFIWPESKFLPQGMATLPDYNGLADVEADLDANNYKFIGILTEIRKLLDIKLDGKKTNHPQDEAFSKLYYQFQYLMLQNELSEAEKIVIQMEKQFSNQVESYLCRLQYFSRLTDWRQLGTVTVAFENHAAWKLAMLLAQPDLQAELQALLNASLALRKKRAEEARREEEIRRLQQPRPKPKSKPAKAAAVSEPPKAISEEEASRILDTIRARVRRLNAHPVAAATKVRELCAIRDMMTSIQHVRPMQEELEACTNTISKLRMEMAEEALAASEILSCYDVLGEVQGVHKKLNGKSTPRGTITQKDIKLQEGVVQCCMRNNCRLALLADGSVIPLDAATHTWLGTDAHRWDDITWLDGGIPAGVRGFRKDGTYVFAADEIQPAHYECGAIADSPFEYRSSGVRLRKTAPEDRRVSLSDDGTLTLRDERNPASGPVLQKNVIGFYIRGSICLALLQNSHVAEIDLTTRVCREFSCTMTEEAVQHGVRNWRRNRAEELLALRKKQLRNPALLALALLGGSILLGPAGWAGAGAAAFSLATRREKCQESIEALNALLAEQ